MNIQNKNNSVFKCDACQFANSVNLNKMSINPFDLVHFDVRYAPVVSIYGHHYFVEFIDDTTRVTWVYLIK